MQAAADSLCSLAWYLGLGITQVSWAWYQPGILGLVSPRYLGPSRQIFFGTGLRDMGLGNGHISTHPSLKLNVSLGVRAVGMVMLHLNW